MNERIQKIVDMTIKGEMYINPRETRYDRKDLFLSPVKRSAKRVFEYILNQPVVIWEESCFTGTLMFDGSVEGDVFSRRGHPHFAALNKEYYNKPIDNLLTFEWQHSVGDFGYIIQVGLTGILADIRRSEEAHRDDEQALEFLQTQTDFCHVILQRAKIASRCALEKAAETENPEYRVNLLRLSEALKKIPERQAESFYEAVLCLYFCYPYIRDSIGLIDRYLYPYYKKDIDCGAMTKEQGKAYLQELFLMLQASISIKSDRFYRGGESHFCIGGYLPDGSDGFNDLSKLIVEALLELPIWIPQLSLRWTRKTPREVFRYMLDCERRDPNKRIAFVNDEPRIQGLMKYTGLSYEEAVNYTMMGCNELALPGGMVFGFDPFNIMRSVESTFHKQQERIRNAADFEEFYAVFEKELFADLHLANVYGKGMQDVRSRDCNIVSNIFLKGCIENAKSCINGGLTRFIAVGLPIGLSNVIDSLTVVKQFVFDEKSVRMDELVRALEQDWEGYELLRERILKEGKFFGNDEECSNEMAVRLFGSLDKWNDGHNYLGKKWVFGNLVGYNEHHRFFGSKMKATPDGRKNGDDINFGIGQTQGKDRNGVTALLASVAKCDPYHILTGPSVTNVLLEDRLVKNDASFEKLVDLFETYFQMGGTHFQLTYVSKENLLKAKENPQDYKNLRVRVSGFADYFVFLNDALQDEIIARTQHEK